MCRTKVNLNTQDISCTNTYFIVIFFYQTIFLSKNIFSIYNIELCNINYSNRPNYTVEKRNIWNLGKRRIMLICCKLKIRNDCTLNKCLHHDLYYSEL